MHDYIQENVFITMLGFLLVALLSFPFVSLAEQMNSTRIPDSYGHVSHGRHLLKDGRPTCIPDGRRIYQSDPQRDLP